MSPFKKQTKKKTKGNFQKQTKKIFPTKLLIKRKTQECMASAILLLIIERRNNNNSSQNLPQSSRGKIASHLKEASVTLILNSESTRK